MASRPIEAAPVGILLTEAEERKRRRF